MRPLTDEILYNFYGFRLTFFLDYGERYDITPLNKFQGAYRHHDALRYYFASP